MALSNFDPQKSLCIGKNNGLDKFDSETNDLRQQKKSRSTDFGLVFQIGKVVVANLRSSFWSNTFEKDYSGENEFKVIECENDDSENSSDSDMNDD